MFACTFDYIGEINLQHFGNAQQSIQIRNAHFTLHIANALLRQPGTFRKPGHGEIQFLSFLPQNAGNMGTFGFACAV